jgi:hypothetical protein
MSQQNKYSPEAILAIQQQNKTEQGFYDPNQMCFPTFEHTHSKIPNETQDLRDDVLDITRVELSGIKYDSGKTDLSLVSLESITGEAKAMEYGAKKYGRNNYKGAMEWTRLLGAALRHTFQFSGKQDLDNESNLNHLYHAKANLGMLIYYYENKLGKDDR